MASTSSAVKRRYNKKTYTQHMISTKKDSPLDIAIAEYKASGKSFNALAIELLEGYFGKKNEKQGFV